MDAEMIMTATSSSETHNSGVLAKLGLIFMSSLCWLQPTKADEQTKQQPIKVFISPECKACIRSRLRRHGRAWKGNQKGKKTKAGLRVMGSELAANRCHTRTQAPQLSFTWRVTAGISQQWTRKANSCGSAIHGRMRTHLCHIEISRPVVATACAALEVQIEYGFFYL